MSLQQPQQEQAPPRVVDVFEDKKGKLFLKTFLIDDSINRAKWRIEKDYIPKHIEKFVGRPFILTRERLHPTEFDSVRADYNDVQGTIGRLLQAQEKYRIGTIRKVEPVANSSVSQASSSTWAAYVEITDPTAITAFRAGYIPKYVSPSIFRLNKNESPEVTTDYEPLHLAAVDYPAYGVHKAGIKGSCEGDLVKCSNQLAQASTTSTTPDCGFCVKDALEGFTNSYDSTITSDSSYLISSTNQASDKLTENSVNESVPAQQQQPPVDTALKQEQSQPQQSQQQPQPQQQQQPQTTQVAPNNTGTGQPFQRVVTEEKKEEIKPAKGNKEGQVEGGTENHTDNKGKDNEVASLKATVEALLNKVNDLESFKKSSEKTQAEKKTAAKRSKIEKAIPENYANSPEERTKAIDSLMKYSDDGSELDYILEKFVSPATQSNNKGERRGIRQAAASSASEITTRAPAPAKKLTDFTDSSKSNNNNTGVSQAGDIVSMRKTARICSMTDIVANMNGGAGGGSF